MAHTDKAADPAAPCANYFFGIPCGILRRFRPYFSQAPQRCDAIPNPRQIMLRFVSVSCLVTAGLSTVLPVSAALLACAAMVEVLKANGAADWPA